MMDNARRSAAVLIAASLQVIGLGTPALVAGQQGLAAGGGNPTAFNDELRDLLALYPGTRFHADRGRVRIIYGVPMTGGATAEEAARNWLRAHAGAFGTGRLELEELWTTPVRNGRFTAIGYRQYIGGLPVEYGNVRLLVHNELQNSPPRVVYAAGTLAPELALDQIQIEVDGQTAHAIVQAMPLFRFMEEWSEPELAINQGSGDWADPTVVWKFVGRGGGRDKTFFVDVATGRLAHVRSEIYYGDVDGTVKGRATPGMLPDTPANPPTVQAIPEIRVSLSGGPGTFTDQSGDFLIGSAGQNLVEIGAGVGLAEGFGGRWVDIQPADADPLKEFHTVTPPATADFLLNPNPSESLTAQVNVFIGTTEVHNYFRDRAPNFSAISIPILARTGVVESWGSTCNAFFRASDPSINFFNAGDNCPNTAYTSVIAHEYGHFIVNRLGLGQGGFGEGYSDTTAMLLYDDGVVGRGFFGPETILRDPKNANVQYPCPTSGSGSGVHNCGQILGGSWWRIREHFGDHYGSAAGLEKVRDLQVAWSLITTGGEGSQFRQSAHPGTAIEVLIIDDDDGNLANGTPNWERICGAFAAHGVACPPLTYLEYEFPEGLPERIPVAQTFDVPVNIIPVATPASQGDINVFYRIEGNDFVQRPAMEVGQDQYIVRLPAAACGQFVDFYMEARAIGGQTVRYPEEGYLTARALIGANETVAADFDFETDQGWTVWNHPSLTEGHWERVVPRGSFYNNQPVQPGTAFRGQHCFLTENGAPGAPVNAHDVDWGPTVLTSPAIDITGADLADLSLAYWHFTLNGIPDYLELDISPDDGANWVRLANYDNSDGWKTDRFDILDHIETTSDLRIRFSIADHPNDSLTESAVDDVRVLFWECPPPPCYANCDGSSTEPILTVDDFTCFINEFAIAQSLPFAEQVNHYANCDGSTTAPVLSVDDFTCFINAFAQGCP